MKTKFKLLLAIALCAGGFAANAVEQPSLTYLDWDAAKQQLVEKTITDYKVYNGEGELDAGTTYVVKSSLDDLSIYVWGTESSPSRLILCDGVKLTEEEGIYLEEGGALIICGQAGGTGELEATGYARCAGIGSEDGGCTVTINGGIVTATGGSYSAGIGSGSDYSSGKVTINGGTVTATGKNGAAGIGGGNKDANTGMVAFGAKFNVLAGSNAAGASSVDQTVYASNHSAAYVSIAPVFGSEGNPWKIGTPNAADVTAYTNGVGGLVVKGAGDMKNFADIKDVPWGQDITSVTIGEGVTGIGAMSFKSSALESVTISSSVTNIGAAAFSVSTSLSNVVLKAVTPPILGGDAFAELAVGLKIYVPCGASKAYKTAWPDYALYITEIIEVLSDEFTVDLRASINLVGETTVSNVMWSATAWGAEPAAMSTGVGYVNKSTYATGMLESDLKGEAVADFALPKKDGEYVLTHSTGNLKSFVTFNVSGTGALVGSNLNPWQVGGKPGDTVAAYVTDNGELVIGGKGELMVDVNNPPWKKDAITSLVIGRDVMSISDYAFYGYTALTNVTFATGAKLESIGNHVFAACPSMEELEIPANVTNCGSAVFLDTPNVTVSENNKTFAVVGGVLCDIKSNKVISGLDGTDVTIPEGMVEIGECAFSTNGALTSVTIPASVTNIAAEAFKGCANLTNVFVRAEDPPTLVSDAFKDCSDGLKIYVPEGTAEAYKEAEGWSDYASKISDMKGAGTKVSPWTVGTGVTAYIENGTLHIEGFGAMEDFTATSPAPWKDAASDIKSVEIGKGVTKVGNCAFIDCAIDAPNTFTVDDEDFELNLFAFLTPDKGSTNTLATGVFRVVSSKTGKAEPIAGFGPKDSALFYGSIEEALTYGDTTSMQVLTLADMVNREKTYLTGIAGDEPYSKTMQDVIDAAFKALDTAKNYDGIVDIHNIYASKIEAQAEKDKTHEIEGTDITWRMMDGTLVIEGEGEMPDFVAPDFPDGAPWDEYKDGITNVTVAAGIESLGKAAFANCPTDKNKTLFFENPAHSINLAAFMSDDGSVTNDFTTAQILLPGADGGVANAVKLLADFDSEAPRYDSIAEAITKEEVSFVTAYTLDGLKEMAEIGFAREAGPQPWTERVAEKVMNAIAEIKAATDVETIIIKGGVNRNAIQTAQNDDANDDSIHGLIPNSDLSWKLVGDQLVIEGKGEMPEVLTPVPWSNSVGKIGTVVVGEGVTTLSKGLFTSDLTAPAGTIIFESKTVSIPRNAFVGADGKINGSAEVLFATKTDDGIIYEAPCGWIDASDAFYESYVEAFNAGATAVQPAFSAPSEKVEDQIENAPAKIVEKVQPVDKETGKFIKDQDGDLIDVDAVVENINTNKVDTSERIVASAVSGLTEVARAEAEVSGCTVVSLTIDAIPSDSSDLVQERMIWEMSDGENFQAKFAEITLATNDVPIAESKSVIELHIPYDTKNNENFSVVRNHDGKIEAFTLLTARPEDPSDLMFLVGDREIVVWTQKFSTYAIGATAKNMEPSPEEFAEMKAAAITEIEGIAGAKPWSDEMAAIVDNARIVVNAATTVKELEEAKAAGLAAVREQYEKEHSGEQVEFLILYPNGDGAFKLAAKSTVYYGTLIGKNGVEGTITLKMTKPNKNGQFNLSATVKTLADKQSYSFKAKKVSAADGVVAENGALTFTLEGANAKSKAAHKLAVTLGGDSLIGVFDDCIIDGARHVFAQKRDPKCGAITPFVGTWTGAFTHPFATAEGVENVVDVTFSAKLSKSGAATVKVYFADGKMASCSTKAEVGTDGVVVVPVTVWRNVGGVKRSIGFRLIFGTDADGNAACMMVDVVPVKEWVSKAGTIRVVDTLKFLVAGMQTVTAKEFRGYTITTDSALIKLLGAPTKQTLKLASTTGRITGTIKWKVPYDARGSKKTKTVSGKVTGVVVNGVGFGTVKVKFNGATFIYEFTAWNSAVINGHRRLPVITPPVLP